MDVTKETLRHCFTYQKPTGDQPRRYDFLTLATKELALAILNNRPPSRERSLAITKLQEVRMWANASIALNESPLLANDEPEPEK